MSIICPTVLASDPHGFRSQLERVEPFASRIQIDLVDGEFASPKTVDLEHLHWPESFVVDIHLMYKSPEQVIGQLIELRPNMIILHSEADGDLGLLASKIKREGIKFGLAILKETAPYDKKALIEISDHILIFGGNLGSFGGQADLTMLNKVSEIKAINPLCELGWDGGANDANVAELANSGIDVINVGGFIQRSETPDKAYAILSDIVTGAN